MASLLRIGSRWIGAGYPTFVVAEVGINHNGSLELAKRLIDAAIASGCDAVKLQKRTPSESVPREVAGEFRETPWGWLTYLEYRRRLEFDREQYIEISDYCRSKNVAWFASCWDASSVEFMRFFNPPCYKIPSARLADERLLTALRGVACPIILSTGMSSVQESDRAVDLLDSDLLVIVHATSIYPCPVDKINLRVIDSLRMRYSSLVGYSGHEVGFLPTVAAVALGCKYVERHLTLDRGMWGTDHAASLEPHEFLAFVRSVREIEGALGDGIKQVYEEESSAIRRLRGQSLEARSV